MVRSFLKMPCMATQTGTADEGRFRQIHKDVTRSIVDEFVCLGGERFI